MNFRITTILVFLVFTGSAFGQDTEIMQNDLQDLVESVIGEAEGEQDPAIIAEDLNFYLDHPLDLNAASAEDLSRLHILNPFQINSLLDYVRKNGPLLSIYELPLVYGFSVDLAEKIEPFVSLSHQSTGDDSPRFDPKKAIGDGRHELLLRFGKVLEQQVGYRNYPDSLMEINPNKRYLGSDMKLYSRYRLRYGDHLSVGWTMENDPGEELFSGSNPYGFDFNSLHLFVSDAKWIDRLAIGDYKVRYGQGLIAWTGFTPGKSSMVMKMMKNIHRIDPYTSKNENLYFRGAAMEKKLGSFRGSFFYSNRNLDANVLDLPGSEDLVVSSLLETGYHRLPRELKDEDVMKEQVMGGSFSWNNPILRVSLNGIHTRFDGELRKGKRPYQMYDFSGSRNSNLSLDYRLSLGRFYLFGEEALSRGGGIAFLNGLYGQLTSEMGMVMLHRLYDKRYHALYSGAFSESTDNQNESGLYMGVQVDLLPSLRLKGYMDAYQIPWLSYLTDGPSEGWEFMMDTEYEFGQKSSLNLRIRSGEDLKNQLPAGRKLATLETHKKTNIRCHLQYHLNEKIILKNRVEKVFIRSAEKSSGIMVYQNIGFKPDKGPFGLDFRYAVFDTDNYDSRVYAYENDVLYAFSVPAFYGKGYRTYINLKYSCKHTDWWLKFARTGYTDRETIGTGLNRINGNTKTELRLQVRLKF